MQSFVDKPSSQVSATPDFIQPCHVQLVVMQCRDVVLVGTLVLFRLEQAVAIDVDQQLLRDLVILEDYVEEEQ